MWLVCYLKGLSCFGIGSHLILTIVRFGTGSVDACFTSNSGGRGKSLFKLFFCSGLCAV